jgi:hypothetical protein
MHGTKFMDPEHSPASADPVLAEHDGPRGIDPDPESGRDKQWRQKDESNRRSHDIENTLDHADQTRRVERTASMTSRRSREVIFE